MVDEKYTDYSRCQVRLSVAPQVSRMRRKPGTCSSTAISGSDCTEETVRTIFRHPLHLVGSDGIFGDRPHPRLYGTVARVLGRYALKERLIPVEEAVAWLTARAADRIGLTDRGRIRKGLRADVVLLDPARFIDTATYNDPKRIPEGIRRVLVGGRTVWADGASTGVLPGNVLREPLPGR
jgi:N-acyl-D-amino-acid deacylase